MGILLALETKLYKIHLSLSPECLILLGTLFQEVCDIQYEWNLICFYVAY